MDRAVCRPRLRDDDTKLNWEDRIFVFSAPLNGLFLNANGKTAVPAQKFVAKQLLFLISSGL